MGFVCIRRYAYNYICDDDEIYVMYDEIYIYY